MDTTTVGIAFGIVLAALYVVLRAYAKQPFELNHTVLVFLAVFSIPGGVALIAASFVGNVSELPSSWREHVTVAGIVAIGLAIQYVFSAFRDCWLSRQKSGDRNTATPEAGE